MRFGTDLIRSSPQPCSRIYPTCVAEERPVFFPEDLSYGILLDDAFDAWPQTNRGLQVNAWNFAVNDRFTCLKPDGLLLFLTEEGGNRAERSVPMVTKQITVFETIYACSSDTMNAAGIFLLDNQHTPILSLTHSEGYFVVQASGEHTLTPVSFCPNQPVGVRLTVNPVNNTITVQIDSRTVATLPTIAKPVAYFAFATGEEGRGYVQLSYLSAHTGYHLRERFFTALDGCLPDNWQVNGDVTLIETPYERNNDRLALRMTPNASIQQTLQTIEGAFSLSLSLFAEEPASLICTAGNMQLILDGCSFSVRIDGKLYENLYTYRPRVWFAVEWQSDAVGNGTLWINHKPIITLAASEKASVSAVHIACIVGNPVIDDITLVPLTDTPEDYVPAPIPASTGDKVVGMLTCDLWRAGNHLGWDRINGFEGGGRKPLLGWYEDGNPEAADWEIKFFVEHGITFRMPCWYRPQATIGKPFKTPLHSEALHEGYLHAKYSNLMKFAVFLTISPGEIDGYNDFVDNILPYLVEYYLKDPRYMTVDNKPLIGLYRYQALRDELGGEEVISAAMEQVRIACRELGYDGALFITSLFGLETAENREVANGSSDLACAYGWGIPFSDSGNGQYAILQYTKEHDGVHNLAASITTGFDFYPWENSNGSGTISPPEFSTLCRNIRDRYLPMFPKESILSRLVMLDNWNEYSEGHAMCPSEEYGFTWLDTIRQTFAEDSPHTDTRPTPHQLARIGLMYNPTRRLTHPPRYPIVPSKADCTRTVWSLSPAEPDNGCVYAITADDRCGSVTFLSDGWHIVSAEGQRFSVAEITLSQPTDTLPPYVEVAVQGDARGYTGRVYFAVDNRDISYLFQTRKLFPVHFNGSETIFLCDIGRSENADSQPITGALTKLQLWFFSDGADVCVTRISAKNTQ